MSDLEKQLRRILTKVRQLQESIKSQNINPDTLRWGQYLDHLKTLGIHFSGLVHSVQPELRHFSAFPERYDVIGRNICIDSALCSSDITELVTEASVSKEQYRAKLAEMGLEEESPMDRNDILERRIRDHNDLCDKVINEVIMIRDLQPRIQVTPVPKVRKQVEIPVFGAIMNCDGEKLPVPDDLRK